jgi:hypothetical protein
LVMPSPRTMCSLDGGDVAQGGRCVVCRADPWDELMIFYHQVW